ncbi:MAG: type 4a pilus biogenesis protein PilO [Patescibacteria group bacterium]
MAEQPKKINPAVQVQQAKRFLLEFYQKPVAQISTELFFTIAATIFFALFAIRPTIITMTELVKEIDDKKKALELLTRKVAALSTVQNQYFTLQDQFYLFDETIPTNLSFQKILQIIEKTASDLQISITSLQVQRLPISTVDELPFSGKKPQLVNLTISITGSYAQIRDFADQLTRQRPLLTIDSVSIANGEKSESLDFLTATITVQAHYYGKEVLKKNAVPTTNTQEPTL